MTMIARQVLRLAALSARRRLLVAGLAGLMVAAGQAPLGLWPVALVGFAVLFAAVLSARGWRGAALCGWAGGVGHFAGSLFWIVEPFLVDPVRHGWMAPFALIGISGGMALFWGLAGGVGFALGRGPGARAIGFALALTGVELMRAYVLTGFPWALAGYVWADTPLMQLAAFIGPHGVTLLTLVAVACLFVAPLGRLAVPVAVLPLVLGYGAGMLRLMAPDPVANDAPVIRLVQPNAEQHLKWRQDMALMFFDRQLEFTAAVQGPRPDLIIWPETAIPWLLGNAEGAMAEIAEAAGGVPVVFGANRRDATRVYNSLVVMNADGAVADVYDKVHLVPFGEYIPYGDLAAKLGLSGFAARDGDGFSPGPSGRLVSIPGLGSALPLICYEAIFPQDLRIGGMRARVLLQITNDAWFGKISGPYQHLAQTRVRAIEQGIPLVRAANTGISAVIDAKGRVMAKLALGKAGWIDAALPAALPVTVYARTGDLPVTLALLMAFALLGWRKRRLAIDRGQSGQ